MLNRLQEMCRCSESGDIDHASVSEAIQVLGDLTIPLVLLQPALRWVGQCLLEKLAGLLHFAFLNPGESDQGDRLGIGFELQGAFQRLAHGREITLLLRQLRLGVVQIDRGARTAMSLRFRQGNLDQLVQMRGLEIRAGRSGPAHGQSVE